jgi:hypothetical protein
VSSPPNGNIAFRTNGTANSAETSLRVRDATRYRAMISATTAAPVVGTVSASMAKTKAVIRAAIGTGQRSANASGAVAPSATSITTPRSLWFE